jgi:DNA-binding NtrC family response regulator
MLDTPAVDRNSPGTKNFPLKVLIVDDDQGIRRLLTQVLSEKGYQVEEADSGEHAMEKLRTNKIKLVLLDIGLPGKSGIELLPEILTSYAGIRVIMVTGLADIATAVKCIKLGARDYVCKPFNIDTIIQVVTDALLNGKSRLKWRGHKRRVEDFVDVDVKNKALARLNSIDTTYELLNYVAEFAGKPKISVRIAQKILTEKTRSGGVSDLHQISVLRGIGTQKFNTIVNALGRS